MSDVGASKLVNAIKEVKHSSIQLNSKWEKSKKIVLEDNAKHCIYIEGKFEMYKFTIWLVCKSFHDKIKIQLADNENLDHMQVFIENILQQRSLFGDK